MAVVYKEVLVVGAAGVTRARWSTVRSWAATGGRGGEVVALVGMNGDKEGAEGVSDAGSVRVERGMGAADVLGGPPLPPGAAVVSVGESEATEVSDSQSSAWESERE